MNWNSSNGPKTTRSIRMRIPELHTDSFNSPGLDFCICVSKIANEIVVTWSAGIFTVGNWRVGYIAMVEEAVSH